MVEKIDLTVHTPNMTNKQIVEDLLQRIPEGASLHDIAREIEFIAAVRQGLTELDHGEHIFRSPRALTCATSSVTSLSTRRIVPYNSVGFLFHERAC
jgi:hypothetical protein